MRLRELQQKVNELMRDEDNRDKDVYFYTSFTHYPVNTIKPDQINGSIHKDIIKLHHSGEP